VISNGAVSFTKEGLENAPQDVIPPKDNTEVQERLRGLVLKKDKVPAEKLNIVWNILLDGKAHTKGELLRATGYTHPSSTGFLKIMAAMKVLESSRRRAPTLSNSLQLSFHSLPLPHPTMLPIMRITHPFDLI
jgi:hypothetical protein